jgi:hypothetical protein
MSWKYAVAQRDKEVDRRLDNGEQKVSIGEVDIKKLVENLHADEIKTVKLEGDLNFLRHAHDGFDRQLGEIRENIVTRQEWESRMSAIEKQLHQILAQLQPRYGGSGRYGDSGHEQSSDPAVKR